MTPLPLFQVESGGLLTTVQDLGRHGHQREGMPVAGAMDPFAASVANLLVGNPRRAALLEITLLGPALRVLADTRLAFCGADLSASVDGEPVPLWKTFIVRAGQRLAFGRRRFGARAFLAVSGGLDVSPILGSRSTFLRGQMGGCEGRRLQPGDILNGFPVPLAPGERGLRPADIPAYDLPARLRVVPGPHEAAFTEAGFSTFFSSLYTLTPQSDRMGYRLHGEPVERADTSDILSEAMPFGGLQLPPDGQPILLMADRQTTGGYPLLGVVISAYLPRAAQLAPGDSVQFQPIALADAQAFAIQQEQWLRVLETACDANVKAAREP